MIQIGDNFWPTLIQWTDFVYFGLDIIRQFRDWLLTPLDWIELDLFPLQNLGAHVTKDDIVKVIKKPLLGALTKENIVSSFKKCGIFPLILIMLENCIGKDPKISGNLPQHSILSNYALQVSYRQKKMLQRN